ncbi:MAG: FAD-dependent oxidoreductase [Candidatus Jordarchaeum sp.]|uniref:FAD-dependent oxidoreductase n=1 Tax=Candidatus Jordarchaeum sp. TaxID=2823881 RepID=UPI004049AC43
MSLKLIGNQWKINKELCQAWTGSRSPCRAACPVDLDVSKYVSLISEGKFREALEVILERMPFPAICGRICHHPCETDCTRSDIEQSIAIRDLKRFVADFCSDEMCLKRIESNREEKVAIVGAGPAGLTAAYDLLKRGYRVTIFEASEQPGGMITSCLPDYRIPREVAEKEINQVLNMGIELRTGTIISEIDKLWDEGFKAMLVAIGAQNSRMIELEGIEGKGVLYGLPFLGDVKRGKSIELGDRVIVIGGGNVAVDCAQCAIRLGAKEVYMVCLESRDEMPAHEWQLEEAVEEGVKLCPSLGPKKILTKDDKVVGLETIVCSCVFDSEGKFSPQFDENTESTMEADTIIIAIGQEPDFTGFEKLDKTPLKTFKVNSETLETNIPGVFAAGDCVNGPASFVEAVQTGHMAAESIDRYLRGEDLTEGRKEVKNTPLEVVPIPRGVIRKKRVSMPVLKAEERKKSFKEIMLGYSEQLAVEEAKRCLNCAICGYCIENFGCIAMIWTDNPNLPDRSPEIDLALCVGCGVCPQICPHKAIEEIK